MNELEFIDQFDNNDSADKPETPENQENNQISDNPSWQDVKEGRVDYKTLPPNLKNKIKKEAYEEIPDDKKYLWDDFGYTPPETYNGVDKNGKPVQGFGLDGFEELVKSGRIKRKTKIEQDVENLSNVVKNQTKTILAQREADIEKKILEAKEGMDFESYEKYRQEKEELNFQKLQLDKPADKIESPQETDIGDEYPVDVQTSLLIFADNNPEFVDIMGKSVEMQKYFNSVATTLYQRNRNASNEEILAATKRVVENRFNINRNNNRQPMFRNTIRSDQKTTLENKATPKLTYSGLDPISKRLINSEAVSGKAKYAGKSLDEITNMTFGHLLKK